MPLSRKTSALNAVSVPIPATMLAAYNLEGAAFSLVDPGHGPATATCSLTPEQVFAVYSTALSAPGATFFVAANGSDSNNGLSSGAPFLSIWKAVQAANAAAVPSKVNVAGGTYYRSNNASNGGATWPTVDIAFVATGSRVVSGTYENFASPSKDGTYTNTYSFARTNVDLVYDLLNVDQFGCYRLLQFVASAAICNITPGSWFTDGTTIWVQRADGAAVTTANTRINLGTIHNWANPNNVNLYWGDGSAGSTGLGFDTEGGSTGCYFSNVSGNPASSRVSVAVGCTFRYSGGRLHAGGKGIGLDSQNGIGWFFNCDASCNASDGFNQHDNNGTGHTGLVTVNCTGNNNGMTPSTSCNGWTHHESCFGYDFAGRYAGNHGGTLRSINATKALLAGTYASGDLGDQIFGGTIQPTAYRTDNTAVYYCFRTKAELMGGTGYEYDARAGSSILMRDVWPSLGARGGAGTIGAW